ncbi:DUF1647 domain-containing protein [Clostridium sp. A1-XYC3]|uniref:DUF1647 domain-containing protein n=1 Tax=Clostridium tanneri TaxID=3037988 RepID=A0ABU4JT38_9CLOT|nr:DUF1647 domain-containing protein [Clostridium sp. A1-XYC3]MDW8801313.1 DUF1647 domain-containing protein [Clostridium sp. A1-XYC3]
MNVLATACNSAYFNACLTLIASIHRLSFNDVDKILVYNLGLTEDEKEQLNSLQKVQVMEFNLDDSYFQEYLTPKQFAWKPYVIKDAGNYGNLILYMDSGAVTVKNIKCLYDIIENDDILIVGDYHPNYVYTHDKCFEIMNATEEEKQYLQIWAGMQGYKVNGKYQSSYVDEAFKFSKLKDAVFGNHTNHRHDQSIYSILCCRNRVPRQDIYIYGEWRGINMNPNQIIYAHRRAYSNLEGLMYK